MAPKEHSGLIRADKVVLFATAAFLALLALCWSIAFLAIGNLGAKHLWNYMGVQGIELSLSVAVLVLIVIRGVDFVAGGSTYRLFVASKR